MQQVLQVHHAGRCLIFVENDEGADLVFFHNTHGGSGQHISSHALRSAAHQLPDSGRVNIGTRIDSATQVAVGLQLQVTGVQPRPGATLLVANHISWLDIAAIHAAVPHARFVSKADVLQWPLLGWLIRNAGTLFIERERKRDALRVVHAMAEALQSGQTVAVFPEGTTGDGATLLPFHANLLQSAIASGTPMPPLPLSP